VGLLSEKNISSVTYTKKHVEIVTNGLLSINEVLNSTNVSEKRSILFCLDKYLDPYYGYNLSYFDDIILLLQKHLCMKEEKEVKEDILQLLTDYSKDSLDYLAEKIDEIEPSLLANSLYALACTFNEKYVPIFIRYKDHENQIVQNTAKEALAELLKPKLNTNE
jgi:hypothetical protein